MLIVGLILMIGTSYIFTWLGANKAYHVVQEYKDNKNNYVKTLEMTKNKKLRPFVGSIISFLIEFGILMVIYTVLISILLLTYQNIFNNPGTFFLTILAFEFIPILVIAYILLPLQL